MLMIGQRRVDPAPWSRDAIRETLEDAFAAGHYLGMTYPFLARTAFLYGKTLTRENTPPEIYSNVNVLLDDLFLRAEQRFDWKWNAEAADAFEKHVESGMMTAFLACGGRALAHVESRPKLRCLTASLLRALDAAGKPVSGADAEIWRSAQEEAVGLYRNNPEEPLSKMRTGWIPAREAGGSQWDIDIVHDGFRLNRRDFGEHAYKKVCVLSREEAFHIARAIYTMILEG